MFAINELVGGGGGGMSMRNFLGCLDVSMCN